MKNLFNRALIGLKQGWAVNTLPPHILLLQKNVYIRIFRIIGGLSLLLVLSYKILLFNIYFIIIIYIFTFFYGLYNFYLTFQRFKHMYKVIKNKKELEVRNSPLPNKK